MKLLSRGAGREGGFIDKQRKQGIALAASRYPLRLKVNDRRKLAARPTTWPAQHLS